MTYVPPVPDSSISVLEQSAANIDEFATGVNDTYTDRGGVSHKTVEGVIKGAEQDINTAVAGVISDANAKIEAAIINAGYVVQGTFTTGATLTEANDVIQWTTGGGGAGEYYRWGGALPKSVPTLSNPNTTGGFGPEAWIIAVGEEGLTPKVINRNTLADAVAETSLVVGDSLSLKERTAGNGGGALWDVVLASTVTVNGIDVVQSAGVVDLALVLRVDGIMSAKAYGAILDWNGTTGTDDTTVLQYLHDNVIPYALDGLTARITGSLEIKSGMRVYPFGGGIYKENVGYIFTTNGASVEDIIIYGGFHQGNALASFADCTGSASGFSNTARQIKFIDCRTAAIDVAFNWDNARVCQIQRGRYACKTGVIYTGKSAECTIDGAIFVKDENFPTIGTTGIKSFANGVDFPEGLSVHKTLFFRFEYNLDIDDLFIAGFIDCYIDSGGVDVQPNRIKYNEKTEGIKFTSCWWFGRGVEWGDDADASPNQFRSNMIGNHFDQMSPGQDVTFKRFAHGITCTGNVHNSDQTGTHVGYVAENNNNAIIIDDINFQGYDSYAQFKVAGENNLVSNIPNRDALSAPVFYEYPVNTYNVEGYAVYTDAAISNGTFNAGDTIAEIDNINLSSGVAWVNVEFTDLSIPSSGFLQILVYNAGTTTINPDVTLNTNLALISYAASDTSIRVNIPFKVDKATDARVRLVNESGSSPTISGGQFANSLNVIQ